MYCKHCGKQLPENSMFCFECGERVNIDMGNGTSNQTVPQSNYIYQNSNVVPTLTEEESEKIKNRSFRYTLVSFLVVIFLIIFLVVASALISDESVEDTAAIPAVSSVAQTSVSSAPVLSPRQQQIEDVFTREAQWQFENTIKKKLKNPDTASFIHDKSSWAADQAILTGSGTVAYKNAKGQNVSEPFTVSIIMNDEYYFALYVELNNIVSINVLDRVDNTGHATRLGANEFGVAEGSLIFQQDSSPVVSIIYEEGKQYKPNKPPTQTQNKSPVKGTPDYSDWVLCEVSLEDFQYIMEGRIVYIDGHYYADPELAKMWENEVIVYTYDAASDPKNQAFDNSIYQ